MTQYTLLGLSGSLRAQSANRKLLREAGRKFGDATYVEANLEIPLYHGDVEDAHGLPSEVQTLVDQIAQADAVLISTPEYNSGISGVLKNALDWISRAPVKPWADKPVAIMSAAAGRTGGARAHVMLRTCLAPFRPCIANGPEILIAECNSQFDENGHITERYAQNIDALMTTLRAEIQRR
ncbi:NAD(P)H-dependent oxidoreductase [Shimia thalassica]|uniref:NADPH-dependent FMN reductase n=1 Tax=Shimia thalassica TaxID=1715693 RepID=UPI001C0969A6|nr:NAD(P)H-dependent oxidoreductase [Shimia thalassica]MBU2942447.1 NAD(P)H-dependent oxidoreductase [Shimia thalassica]MDO6504375.1 NAD(P)H-dependent oxidoreductase [Shimia thalassica]